MPAQKNYRNGGLAGTFFRKTFFPTSPKKIFVDFGEFYTALRAESSTLPTLILFFSA
jgi:hypothetical protein